MSYWGTVLESYRLHLSCFLWVRAVAPRALAKANSRPAADASCQHRAVIRTRKESLPQYYFHCATTSRTGTMGKSDGRYILQENS